MPRIFELDPHVADLIAAGEVVERPASVVKELMENSIDADAGIVTVEIAAGGMTFIRVTDNGCGIAPEDVGTAFLRHATSKLRVAGDLEAIGTLGFRGEALAAIAAVSRVELLTREPGAGEGVSLLLEAGEVVDVSPAGCPEGTTIFVRDLFFNTPARLKFMKSDRAESSAVASAVLRCALSHPEVSVRFIRDGKTEFHTPGDSRADSCIYSLFGREFSAELLSAESSDEAVAVSGFVSAPAAARGNRSYQFYFVNGRSIRSLTLQAALEQAFANTLPSGRFPSCVLYITIRIGDVDVNVHPAKTEVKFVSDKQVFDGVYYAALGALEKARRAAGDQVLEDGKRAEAREAASGGTREFDVAAVSAAGRIAPAADAGLRGSKSPNSGSFKSMQVEEYKRKYGSDTVGSGAAAQGAYSKSDSRFHTQSSSEAEVHAQAEAETAASASTQVQFSELTEDVAFVIPNAELHSHFRVIGEALNTYIIIEKKSAVWFIDKHAAHERIHFDMLRRGDYAPMSQALITPVICRHGHEEVSLLLENADMLNRLGFSVESFGEDSVAVREIPADIDIGEAEPALSEICSELKLGSSADPTRRDNIYRSVACKAAIKAGKASGAREHAELAARVMSGEISHCPHGRPVAFEITKGYLDKGFKRV